VLGLGRKNRKGEGKENHPVFPCSFWKGQLGPAQRHAGVRERKGGDAVARRFFLGEDIGEAERRGGGGGGGFISGEERVLFDTDTIARLTKKKNQIVADGGYRQEIVRPFRR